MWWLLWGCTSEIRIQPQTPVVVPPLDTAPVPVSDPPLSDPPDVVLPQWVLYANTSEMLYRVDPSTGTPSEVASFWGDASEGFVDIAISPAGVLVGGTSTGVYAIQPETAETTLLCQTEANLMAMTFWEEVLIVGTDRLSTLSVETCTGQEIPYTRGHTTSGDVVVAPGEALYWSVRGPESDHVLLVDPRGVALPRDLGPSGYSRMFGLAWYQELLYGFSAQGEVVQISPQTGRGTLLTTQEMAWWGASANPVLY